MKDCDRIYIMFVNTQRGIFVLIVIDAKKRIKEAKRLINSSNVGNRYPSRFEYL